jgi:hypothetical protein
LAGTLQKIVAQNQIIHLGIDETAVGVIGSTNDRFAADVKGGIDEHGAARSPLKFA